MYDIPRSCVLLQPNGKVHSIGQEALCYYNENAKVITDWYFFDRLGEIFDEEKNVLTHDTWLEESRNYTRCELKKMKAIDVLAAVLCYIKEKILNKLSMVGAGNTFYSEDILWVITKPTMRAEQFIRDAAKEDISNEIAIIHEPDALSEFCASRLRKLRGFEPQTEIGDKYLVFNLGDGTTDITLHEITGPRFVKEIYRGDSWKGNALVCGEVLSILNQIFCQNVGSILKESYNSEYIDLISNIEDAIKKPNISQCLKFGIVYLLCVPHYLFTCACVYTENGHNKLKSHQHRSEVTCRDRVNRASVFEETTRSKPGEDRQPDIEQEHQLNMALYARIKFSRLLLTLLLSLNKEKCEGVPHVKKLVTQMEEVLPVIRTTLSCGIQPETKEVSKNGIGNKKNPLHFLVIHGSIAVKNPPIFKLDSVKDWFESSDSNGRVEGVVWHCPAGVLYKVHRHHLNLSWPIKEPQLSCRKIHICVDVSKYELSDDKKSILTELAKFKGQSCDSLMNIHELCMAENETR
ncbi:unnamed protein product [Mytilus edulis]|uniref:RNA ligase 1 n=1 Tax=Mytilus edulis TaxID=6550 RepID=A0A8S3SY28_MYTED|nr:unnamed protein product [Mytilus edulis]